MPLKFFNIDLHVSVIQDVKTVFSQLFSNVEVHDWSISGHAHLFPHAIVRDTCAITQQNWRHFNQEIIRKFQFEDDDFLRTYDGFIVTHTPIFVMLFEKYNKPVIVVNSCRYNQPICWSNDRMTEVQFHECLKRLDNKELLTIVHNNVPDLLFFQRCISLKPSSQLYIPSLCEYVNAKHDPQSIVTIPTILIDDPLGVLLRTFGSHPKLVPKPSRYQWKQLYQYQAILVIPKEISTMTLFEYYQSATPLILPSKQFLKYLIETKSLSLETLNSYNLQSFENLYDDWVDHADYYAKHFEDAILYFDSFEHLRKILDSDELESRLYECHVQMKRVMETRREEIMEAWKDMFHFRLFPFICYNFWSHIADYHLDTDYKDIPQALPFYKRKLIPHDNRMFQENALVFVKTDFLPQFTSSILPNLHKPFRIVIGVSDLSPTSTDLQRLLENNQCTKILSTNCLLEHPKIVHIPIGFEEPLRPNGNQVIIRESLVSSLSYDIQDKDIGFFIRKFSSTSSIRTHFIENVTSLFPYVLNDIVHLTYKTKDTEELYSYLRRSKYALCLRGNGIDTHYVYECILNRCVPIFWNDEPFHVYTSFPSIIQIQRPEDLQMHSLETMYQNIDWEQEINKLFRVFYKNLKSC
jgi:hypothetical protein